MLAACLTLEHLPRAVDPEVVRDHEPCNHDLAGPPGGLHDPLTGSGHGVAGEHHAGGFGLKE